MDLMELKTLEQWQEALDRITEKYPVHAALTNTEGKILVKSGRFSPLCDKLRESTERLTFVCSQTSTFMLNEAKKDGEPYTDYCDLGLFKTVVPVYGKNGEFLGGLTSCGAAVPDEPLDDFMVSQTIQIEEDEAKELMKTAPVIHLSDVEEITKMLSAALEN